MHWDPLLHGGGAAAAESQGHAGRHQEERDHPGRPRQGGTRASFKAGLRKAFFQVCGKRKERRVCCAAEQQPVQTFVQAAAPLPKKIGTFSNIFDDIAGIRRGFRAIVNSRHCQLIRIKNRLSTEWASSNSSGCWRGTTKGRISPRGGVTKLDVS